MDPFSAAPPAAVILAVLPPFNPLMALGSEGWGLSETLAVAVAAALLVIALGWVALLKAREGRQNQLLQEQLKREKVLSELGRKLAAARGIPEAARIVLDAADDFFGWDSAYLDLYSQEQDILEPVINLDQIEGRRADAPFVYPAGKPSPMARRIIEEGAKLVRRDKEGGETELLPFGDKQRRSASLMYAPVHGTRGVIGILSIQSYTPGFYNEEKLALLQGLADHCGGALDRIRAENELQKHLAALEDRVKERTGELTRLNSLLEKSRSDLEKQVEERTARLTQAVGALEGEIAVRRHAEARNGVFSRLGGQLSAAADFEAAGKIALETADELLGWEACYIHLYTSDFRFAIPILAFDVVDGKREKVFHVHREISARDKRIIEHGAELVCGPPAQGQPAFEPFGVRSRPTASRLFVPVRSQGRVIGAMSVQSYTPEAYSAEDLVQLQSLADFCAGAFERIQAEELLRQSEERFSTVFRSSPAPMSLTTLEQGTYLDVNDSLTSLLGYTRAEMIGRTSIELKIWPDPDERLKMAQVLLSHRSLRNFQCQLRTKAGNIRTALASVERIDIRGEQNVIVATFHDITESLNLEAQLRQAQKMEAVGQLAAGVAHDFNNILTIIQGHIGLLLEDQTLSSELRDALNPVAGAAERAALLTRQLLAFSRKQVMMIGLIDLNDVVGNATNMLQRLLGENILLKVNYASGPVPTEGDDAMIEQVIVNLAVNARDAMPGGGELRVGVDIAEVPSDVARQRTDTGRTRFARLTVSDSGQGMDEETKSHIFEPFFTTKDVGRGTGLGLATVYGVIKQHRGWIDVESEVGKGTAFRIYFPASEAAPVTAAKTETVQPGAAPSPAVKTPEQPQNSQTESKAKGGAKPARSGGGRGETILVVEDELDLRDLVHTLLQTFGYRVLEAQHGREAIEIFAREGGKIDLLLTDVTMPEGISGLDLAERFRKENPALKVIFSSGYNVELFERRKIPGLREGLNFLPKPYQPDTLAATVRKCLDS